jgi:hypothetical protein
MHPFMIEQMTSLRSRDLKAGATQKALAAADKGKGRRMFGLLLRLGSSLRAGRAPVPALALVPLCNDDPLRAAPSGGERLRALLASRETLSQVVGQSTELRRNGKRRPRSLGAVDR